MDLDEKLFRRAWQLTGLRTKKAVVEEALRWLVRLHEQAGVRELRGQSFDVWCLAHSRNVWHFLCEGSAPVSRPFAANCMYLCADAAAAPARRSTRASSIA